MLDFYKNKRVFITGHTGFKGSWLSKILVMAGAKVAGYSLELKDKPRLYNLLDAKDEIKTTFGDIRDVELLKKAMKEFKPDIVFHLAAQPIVRESYANPRYTYEVNVMGTINVLEAIRECDSVKSFVNITTDKVYLNREWVWGYREDERLCGYDPYSNSKSCSELVTYSYLNSFFKDNENIAISTARSGNVIGGGDFAKDRIIPDCCRAAAKNEEIIVRNPYSTRPYQHVLDCLNGYLTLAEKQYNNRELAGNYNFGPNDESCINTGNLVDMFCKLWKINKATWKNVYDGGPHEAQFLKLDCSKAKSKLEWMPKLNIRDALSLVVEWYEAYSKNEDVNVVTEKQITNYFKE